MVRSEEVDEIRNRRRHILELSDVAIFYIFRRQNIYGGRPHAVICERRIYTSSEAHILHHAVDRVMA